MDVMALCLLSKVAKRRSIYGVKALAPKDAFDPEFLYHYLRSVKFPSLGYSRHYKLLREIDVPKPPLSERRRIVDILNRANGIFAAMQAGKFGPNLTYADRGRDWRDDRIVKSDRAEKLFSNQAYGRSA